MVDVAPIAYQARDARRPIVLRYTAHRATSRGMDWKLLASTFLAVFFAELGDKTQLATLALASGGRSKTAVFLGSALALVMTSAIAVLAGGVVSRYVSPLWLRRVAGVMFLGLGALFLLRRE